MDITKELRKIPIIKLLIALVIGIELQLQFSFNAQNLIFSIITNFLILIFVITSRNLQLQYSHRWISGALISLLLIQTGIYIVFINQTNAPKLPEGVITTTAIICEIPEEKNKTIKALAKLTNINDSTHWTKINTKAVLFFEKDSASRKLEYGDLITVQTNYNEIKNNGNPNEFDYQNYLASRNIFFQAYIKKANWKLLDKNQGNFLSQQICKIRCYLLSIYQKYGINNQEYAVLAALSLGYKAELDYETRQAYSTSGAMHVLAVSGLHVGIIFMSIGLMLKFLDKKKWGKIIKGILTLICLWFYASLAGLSPSVMRAATMFSLVVIGTLLYRKTTIYNTLSISAFLLLIINPMMINDVGFQLSYSAVISIVFFAPKIEKLIYIKNKKINWAWQLTAVSIAAFIGTFPLTVYYFHQFPVYFILTNLIVIPLGTFILYGAMILLFSSIVPVLASICGFILKYMVFAMNFSVQSIEAMPSSAIKGLQITNVQMWLIYGLVIMLAFFMLEPKLRYIKISFAIILILLSISTFNKFNSENQKKIIVYNIKGAMAIDLIKGSSNYLLCDTSLINNKNRITSNFQINWLVSGIKNTVIKNIDSLVTQNYKAANNFTVNSEFINFHGKKILILRNKTLIENHSSSKVSLDYIVLSNNAYLHIEDINKLFDCKTIIIDSSNSKIRTDRWKEECQKLDIAFFAVSDQGAFIADI